MTLNSIIYRINNIIVGKNISQIMNSDAVFQ